jgi:hypothetical protein
MTLQPGCRFTVAPHFHLSADWPRRLLVGAGVEEAEARFFPREPWRPPTADELALLVMGPTPEAPPEAGCVWLFALPEHLRSAWWDLLDQATGPGDGLPGFDGFVDRLGGFLTFKEFPLPEAARCDVVVSRPGERSVRWDADARRPGGLACSLAPWAPWPGADAGGWPRLWGGINLGDEETSVVLLNLPCRQLEAELHRRVPDGPPPAAVGELTRRFLHGCPDYPPVRVLLGPGEGYRLPGGGLIVDGYPGDRQRPDILLLVTEGSGFPPGTEGGAGAS